MAKDHDELIDLLYETGDLSDAQLKELLSNPSSFDKTYLCQLADEKRQEIYGKDVYLRGLIEFTNICKNDCYYCGIRRSNPHVERYRLTPEEIYSCAEEGYKLGFRTFVLQGGEDPYFTDERMCAIIRGLKERHPDCAITLGVGEKPRESYQAYFDAGADRFLLRHETANESHYGQLHPSEMSLQNRKECLYTLREIGYQVGCGMMIGSPYQTVDCLIEDLRFMQDLQPHMIGIGPFIPHKDTIFKEEAPGSADETLLILSILRLMFPYALIPATTALGTVDPLGREKGIQAGCNVIMPNLSPGPYRDKYLLYDNKICVDDCSAECRGCVDRRMDSIGYEVVSSRGDSKVNF